MRSFGTGTHVKLPGAAPDRPNVYDFSTTYDEIYNDLWKKDRLTYPFVSLSLLFHYSVRTAIIILIECWLDGIIGF